MIGENNNARSLISRRLLCEKAKFSSNDLAKAAFDTRVIEAEAQILTLVALIKEPRANLQTAASRLSLISFQLQIVV
jgi:hypothetical protein